MRIIALYNYNSYVIIAPYYYNKYIRSWLYKKVY
jgi:hypothetical protein